VTLLVKSYPAFFVEPEGSLPCSQKPAMTELIKIQYLIPFCLSILSHVSLTFNVNVC